jgi:transposase
VIPQGVQVFVALDPVDLRCSFDRLSGIAKEQIGYDARSGALFIFFGRRRTALKVLFFDGTGMAIFYKRLDRRTFQIPEVSDTTSHHVEIDDATLEALLDGIAVEEASPPSRPKTHWPRTRCDRRECMMHDDPRRGPSAGLRLRRAGRDDDTARA